jgi:hypothetical protein
MSTQELEALQKEYDAMLLDPNMDMGKILNLAKRIKALKAKAKAEERSKAKMSTKIEAERAKVKVATTKAATRATSTSPKDPPKEDLMKLAKHCAQLVGVLSVEITGSWVWITCIPNAQAETDLTNLGFKVARQKTNDRTDGNIVWYWGTASKRKRSNTPWDKIRSKYGSQRLDLDD